MLTWWPVQERPEVATWSDVGLVAVGGGIGFVSSYVTARLQMGSAREDRRAAERAARVERVAPVLGPIRTLLIEMNPEAFAVANLDILKTYLARWTPLRDQLEVVAVAEPSTETRDLIRRFEVAMARLFTGLSLMVSPDMRERYREAGWTKNFYEDTVEHHAEAERLVDAILTELHREGNTRATRTAEGGRDAGAASTAEGEE